VALTVFDASVVIAILDPDDAHHPTAVEALRSARAVPAPTVVLPASAYAEVLVHPERAGEAVATTVRDFCKANFRVEPLTVTIAEAASRLRAQHGSLRLPDALVIATAETLSADALVTADKRWRAYFSQVIVLGESKV
jgi:predicted nucleic acid-binding protein